MSTIREVAERIVITLLYGPNTDYNGDRNAAVTEAIAEALQTERERAAKIAEEHYADSNYHAFYTNAGFGIAAAIREGKPHDARAAGQNYPSTERQPQHPTCKGERMPTEPLMFYFGPWDQPGHYLSDENGRQVRDVNRDTLPWRGEVDGKMQPHRRDCNGRAYCGCDQPEGVARLHHKDGWTALSFWDRSLDGRSGCNSTYFAKGEFSFEEMVAMAKARFARRWNRMNFEVRPEC